MTSRTGSDTCRPERGDAGVAFDPLQPGGVAKSDVPRRRLDLDEELVPDVGRGDDVRLDFAPGIGGSPSFGVHGSTGRYEIGPARRRPGSAVGVEPSVGVPEIDGAMAFSSSSETPAGVIWESAKDTPPSLHAFTWTSRCPPTSLASGCTASRRPESACRSRTPRIASDPVEGVVDLRCPDPGARGGRHDLALPEGRR